jgi:hypothetical protein
VTRRRALRVVGTLVVTGLGAAYLVSKIDLGETGHVIANAKLGYVFGSLGIMAASVLPMAWRWQILLIARGIRERLGWLVRAYFVSYTVGQVLPTSIGGDASRIYETTRRHSGAGGPIAGAVLLDMVPDRHLAGAIRKRLEVDGDRVCDLHLWRLGPGHTGLIAAVVSDRPQAPSAYKHRLEGLAGLSHMTIEVHACADHGRKAA